MPHWIAIGTNEAWRDPLAFVAALADSARWRPSARTTVSSVLMLDDGRFVAECHGPALAEFEAWLADNGWQVESCRRAERIARTGSIWDLA
ncbi:MAG: hypothetical protein ACKVP1_12060 [Burkholderiaceae bacterium]